MKTLTIFYDADCGLCSKFRKWMESQALRVEVEFLDYHSEDALRKFPKLREVGADREVVVMADDGRWWQGASAWVTCLWATRDHLAWAHRLSSPALLPFVRKAVYLISENRLRFSKVLGLNADAELQYQIQSEPEPACAGGSCMAPPPLPNQS